MTLRWGYKEVGRQTQWNLRRLRKDFAEILFCTAGTFCDGTRKLHRSWQKAQWILRRVSEDFTLITTSPQEFVVRFRGSYKEVGKGTQRDFVNASQRLCSGFIFYRRKFL